MIGLMDCNNFFVSCERLFRPDLREKPVAVLSSNDGCIVARSQEVKDLGVQMGVPYFEVKDLCIKENVTLFSSNFALYRDISSRVMVALRAEFPACEVYSVDEAFFEIDDAVTEEEIKEIRARIMQKTGIPVSIGVAETKTLAKVANGIAKKRNGRLTKSNIDGVCILTDELWEDTQKELLCGSIWGIGRQTSALLSKHKIYTVSELLEQDATFLKSLLGIVGERLVLELSGTPVFKLGEHGEDEQKSYMSTRSFGTPIRDKLTLMSALGHHVAHIAEKLRTDGVVASRVSIIARGSRFGDFAGREGTASSIFDIPTDDTFILTKEVGKLLDKIYDAEIPYKKAGVVVGGIMPNETTSHSLFEPIEIPEKTRKLNVVTDFLNSKFGTGTVRSGVTLNVHKWQERKQLKSAEYTTKWTEIARVKAI